MSECNNKLQVWALVLVFGLQSCQCSLYHIVRSAAVADITHNHFSILNGFLKGLVGRGLLFGLIDESEQFAEVFELG